MVSYEDTSADESVRVYDRGLDVSSAQAYGRFAQRMLSRSSARSMAADEPSVLAELQGCLDSLLADAREATLLDAGCGRNRPVPVLRDCYVVGIDVSDAQLADNTMIDEAIVGDVQTCDLGHERFDAAICWFVLEHLRDPTAALANLTTALKPGGVLVLAVPHPFSVKGLVTKFTPLWFHRWVWRAFLGRGKHEADPFPTVMSTAITPRAMRAFAGKHGLTVEFASEYEGWEQKMLRGKLRITGYRFLFMRALVRILSAGLATAASTDVIMAMRKVGGANEEKEDDRRRAACAL